MRWRTPVRVRSSAGPFGPLLAWMISVGFSAPAHLLDRFVEPLAVVGEIGSSTRCRSTTSEHVALVHQLLRDLLEQLLQPRGVGEVEVEVVHEEQQDAAGSVVGWPRRRRMMPSCGGGGGGSNWLRTWPLCTRVKVAISCLTPSSNTSNSSFFKSATNWPPSSRAMTSVVTRSMATRNVGCDPGRLCRGPDQVVPPAPGPDYPAEPAEARSALPGGRASAQRDRIPRQDGNTREHVWMKARALRGRRCSI